MKSENGEIFVQKKLFRENPTPLHRTPCNAHNASTLQGFQIYANPTPTLHQPYTLSAFVMQKINNL